MISRPTVWHTTFASSVEGLIDMVTHWSCMSNCCDHANSLETKNLCGVAGPGVMKVRWVQKLGMHIFRWECNFSLFQTCKKACHMGRCICRARIVQKVGHFGVATSDVDRLSLFSKAP